MDESFCFELLSTDLLLVSDVDELVPRSGDEPVLEVEEPLIEESFEPLP